MFISCLFNVFRSNCTRRRNIKIVLMLFLCSLEDIFSPFLMGVNSGAYFYRAKKNIEKSESLKQYCAADVINHDTVNKKNYDVCCKNENLSQFFFYIEIRRENTSESLKNVFTLLTRIIKKILHFRKFLTDDTSRCRLSTHLENLEEKI